MKTKENENVKAFLDIAQISEGHTLVIPKKHYKNIFDIPESMLKEIIKTSKKVSELLKKNLGAEGINLLNSNNPVAQQEVFHYHMHVIPRYSKDKFKIEFKDPSRNENLEELKKISEKIKG